MDLLKHIFGEKMQHKCSIHSVTLPNFLSIYVNLYMLKLVNLSIITALPPKNKLPNLINHLPL
jgi:hypothetical protein